MNNSHNIMMAIAFSRSCSQYTNRTFPRSTLSPVKFPQSTSALEVSPKCDRL
ncbi:MULTISPECIES: hypothetical protein [unclassified Nostoc]|uniref:hypothetical protein n=1 Tax=unclassified Nostoc TaxID=2593658 RepID=UPI0026227AE8|nr:hypothetical protein [Nostoc sp. S13]MDF5737374.1 hypothetical protein [Nostoc sp. S13]